MCVVCVVCAGTSTGEGMHVVGKRVMAMSVYVCVYMCVWSCVWCVYARGDHLCVAPHTPTEMKDASVVYCGAR